MATFMYELPPKARAKVARSIDLLGEYGPGLGMPQREIRTTEDRVADFDRRRRSMKWEKFRDELMQDGEFRAEWDALESEYQLMAMLIERRKQLGISQDVLAKRTGMKQSAIARLESGKYNPSLKTLRRVAKGLDAEIEILLQPERRK